MGHGDWGDSKPALNNTLIHQLPGPFYILEKLQRSSVECFNALGKCLLLTSVRVVCEKPLLARAHIRDVQNFNILLNMSAHVLVYCSWGQGTQKKNSAFNSFGKQWHRPRPFLAIPLTGKITKIALFTMMQLFNCLKTLFLQYKC